MALLQGLTILESYGGGGGEEWREEGRGGAEASPLVQMSVSSHFSFEIAAYSCFGKIFCVSEQFDIFVFL